MTIQSLVRASDILSLFSIERPKWGTNEIARTLGMPKTTISSLVRTLAEIDLLKKEPDTGKYSLGINLFTLGIVTAETLNINQLASGPAMVLSEKTNQICHIAIWGKTDTLITFFYSPADLGIFGREMFPRRVGPKIMSYCTAMGRCLLAYLKPDIVRDYLHSNEFAALTPYSMTNKEEIKKELVKIREQGFAISDQELILDYLGIAAPIFSRGAKIEATICLGFPDREIFLSNKQKYITAILNTSAAISRSMGYVHELHEMRKRSKGAV